MAATIVYYREKQGSISVPIKDSEIKIGRDPSYCDIILDYDEEVSGRHAKIFRENNRYFLEDLNSTNGSYINNIKIRGKKELDDSAKIKIGKVEFTFVNTDTPPAGQDFSHTYLHTIPVSLKKKPITQHSLTKNQVIGRNPECNIVLDHSQVSWKHADLVQSGTGFKIIDYDSTNGTFLNGRRLTGASDLKANDIIQIGPFKLMFDGRTLAQMSEQGNIRLDVSGLSVIREGNKKILNGVNLSIKPQDFVAIVGSSGAGKSTLLRALCGAAFAEEGTVLVNGMDFYDNFDSFRSMLGYVPQDDIIHRQLTVKNALYYAAELRLPADTRGNEVESIINDILSKLGMTSHAHKTVSSLSGGQRKRVSIAVEMLTNPSLFFLDEPTSGLDPATEESLMKLMRERAKLDGKTVILVTHVTKNVDLCDKIIVMGAGGYLSFYGIPDEALEFFKVKEFTEIYNKIDTPDKATECSARFYNSEYYRNNIESPLSEIGLVRGAKSPSQGIKHGINLQKNNTSGLRQFWTLTKRYWDIKTKDLKNIFQTTAMLLGVCMLLRIIFGDDVLNTGGDENNFGDAIKLVFFLCCIALWFGTSGSSLEVIGELPIYLRESMINLKIVPYVMSKLLVLSFIAAIQTALMTLILLSFEAIRSNFFILFWLPVGIFFTFFTSICVGLALSTLVKKPEGASSWLPIILVIQIIFSGAIVPLNSMDKIKTPLRYISVIMPSRWAFTLIGETLEADKMLYDAMEEGSETEKALYKKIYGKFKGSFLSIKYPVDESHESLKDYGKDAYEALFALILLGIISIITCCLALWDKEVRREEFMK